MQNLGELHYKEQVWLHEVISQKQLRNMDPLNCFYVCFVSFWNQDSKTVIDLFSFWILDCSRNRTIGHDATNHLPKTGRFIYSRHGRLRFIISAVTTAAKKLLDCYRSCDWFRLEWRWRIIRIEKELDWIIASTTLPLRELPLTMTIFRCTKA